MTNRSASSWSTSNNRSIHARALRNSRSDIGTVNHPACHYFRLAYHGAGESENLIGGPVDGRVGRDALGGLVAVEFQRRLCARVLRRSFFPRTAGVVAAVLGEIYH